MPHTETTAEMSIPERIPLDRELLDYTATMPLGLREEFNNGIANKDIGSLRKLAEVIAWAESYVVSSDRASHKEIRGKLESWIEEISTEKADT